MGTLITDFPPIEQSITNSNVKDEFALDLTEPFSFLQFIKVVKSDFTPETLQAYYNSYLTQWYTKTGNKDTTNTELILDQYKTFLKELTLNFTTQAEKKFLSQIDFDDEKDLVIASSFYARKIREISDYYKGVRNNLHYTLTKKKTKGSNFKIEKFVREFVIEYLENRDNNIIDYNIDTVIDSLETSVTEYFDVYTEYFNSEPDKYEHGKVDIGYDNVSVEDLFLKTNSQIISSAFSGFSLKELELKEVNDLLDNKRELTKKYIGTDFFYISSNNAGEFVYDRLFKSENPSQNFLNRDYPTFTSTRSETVSGRHDLGVFDNNKTGIVIIQSKPVDFFFKNKYEPDNVYIFPDPRIFTNDQKVLTFNISKAQIVKNLTGGITKLQPNTTKDDTSFLGYVSDFYKRTNNIDFSFIFNEGYIDDLKYDLQGNQYGLLKDDNLYRQNIRNVPTKYIKSLVLNGYQFYDELFGEGFSFDYGTEDSSTYTETIRSGLSSLTNGFSGLPLSAYNIFFRYFAPYQDLISPTTPDVDFIADNEISVYVRDGGYFQFSDGSLPDPISTDLDAFTNSSLQFYFNELLEAGAADFDNVTSTFTRPLCDSLYPQVSGDFTLNIRLSGENNVSDYNNGKFTDTLIFNFTPVDGATYLYDDTVLNKTTTLENDQSTGGKYDKLIQPGNIYVRDNFNNITGTIFDIMPHISDSYPQSVVDELSGGVLSFNIYNNTLFIQTGSYLVVENINYSDNQFSVADVIGTYFEQSSSPYSKISTRFAVGDDVYFTRTNTISTSDLKTFAIYPEIYKHNELTTLTQKVFPTNTNTINTLSSDFIVTNDDVLFTEVDTPVLTYNSNNNLFMLSFLLKDQNKQLQLQTITFDDRSIIRFFDVKSYVYASNSYTYVFSDTTPLTSFNFNLSSDIITSENNYIVL